MAKHVQVRLNGTLTSIDDSAVDRYVTNLQSHADALSPLLKYAESILKADDIVFDVGANIGLTTIGLARLVPNGKVLAFEPSRINAERLHKNLALNNITNTEIIQAAVSSQPGGLYFVENAEAGSASHVIPSIAQTNVQTVALDAYRDTGTGRGPALIKIDVEGHEPWVLDSAAKLIQEFRPALWMEFNAWCLLAFGAVNPLDFAQDLFSAFSAMTTKDGTTLTPVSDHISFCHENIVVNGCVTDLILNRGSRTTAYADFVNRKNEDRSRGPVGGLESINAQLAQRCTRLEMEVQALKNSTSWRMTRPIRAIKRFMS